MGHLYAERASPAREGTPSPSPVAGTKTAGPPPPWSLLGIVVGLMLQALSAFAEKRVSRNDREPILTALLRALGADGRRIRSTLARLPKPALMSEAAKPAPRRRGALETGAGRTGRSRRSAA